MHKRCQKLCKLVPFCKKNPKKQTINAIRQEYITAATYLGDGRINI